MLALLSVTCCDHNRSSTAPAPLLTFLTAAVCCAAMLTGQAWPPEPPPQSPNSTLGETSSWENILSLQATSWPSPASLTPTLVTNRTDQLRLCAAPASDWCWLEASSAPGCSCRSPGSVRVTLGQQDTPTPVIRWNLDTASHLDPPCPPPPLPLPALSVYFCWEILNS